MEAGFSMSVSNWRSLPTSKVLPLRCYSMARSALMSSHGARWRGCH